MIARIVPPSVIVVETPEHLRGALFPEELRVLGRAVEKRRREFTTGRVCARLALQRLGVATVAIKSEINGQPVWPSGVVGSITHCTGLYACAVARYSDVASLGIDAELNRPLPHGVLKTIASEHELEHLNSESSGVHTDRLLFSAKEATYKAWSYLTRGNLDFEHVAVAVDSKNQTFRSSLRVRGPIVDGKEVHEFHGRWYADEELLCTAVVVERPVT